ncbi:unnamed protein product [Ixodes pacificus]
MQQRGTATFTDASLEASGFTHAQLPKVSQDKLSIMYHTPRRYSPHNQNNTFVMAAIRGSASSFYKSRCPRRSASSPSVCLILLSSFTKGAQKFFNSLQLSSHYRKSYQNICGPSTVIMYNSSPPP